jgi:hypothetical protein
MLEDTTIKDDFVAYSILALICFILIIFIIYVIYIRGLSKRQCSYMDGLYPKINGNLRPLNSNDPDLSGNLCDYYIKTAYNACSGGSYKNDYVEICNLKAILKQGVRGLDFEIYSIDDKPVVATSSSSNPSYHVKESLNSVPFEEVMRTISNYAFGSGSAPNQSDPIIIHLRLMSTNQKMFKELAKIFKKNDGIMLGKEYRYENYGKNIGGEPLLKFLNKVILIIDRNNNSFLECKELLEYVNLTSGSVFMRAYEYAGIKNNPDINELQEYNRRNMSIVLPDRGVNPSNPSGLLCRETGSQMVAFRYQLTDNYLAENQLFFDTCTYAFCLKPLELRYKEVTIPTPKPQKPEYSYETRTKTTDYYSFKF